MSKQNDKKKEEARRLVVEEGRTLDSVAEELGVSFRTVFRWDKEGGWRNLAKADNVVRLTHTKRERRKLDDLEIVENAIINLDGILAKPSIDPRGVGGVAGALVRLLEYRRKIAPPTAAEMAEQALALGITPTDFVQELKKAWQQQQQA